MSYDRRSRRALGPSPGPGGSRSVVGYWVPLIVTVTAATIALGAWVWSERRDSDGAGDGADYAPGESEDAAYARRLRDQRRSMSQSQGVAEETQPSDFFEVGPGGVLVDKHGRQLDLTDDEHKDTFISRMSDVIRRTPSPQQIYDGASRRMAAGVAAVGRSLRSIAEENKDDFGDHERWSEEAEQKDRAEDSSVKQSLPVSASVPGARKRLVAVVLSADHSQVSSDADLDTSYHIEHASILSHLIGRVNPDAMELLVLIYAPQLKTHPLSQGKRRVSSSAESTFSNISGREATGDTSEVEDDQAFESLQTQAATLVSHPTHIMPFTSPTGHVHILRHIAPSLVYLQDSLSGPAGEHVKQIEGWVGQVVVVVGADVGAGLVDTETETEDEGPRTAAKAEKDEWWRDEARVGLGKGVELVDADRIGDDWTKRLSNH